MSKNQANKEVKPSDIVNYDVDNTVFNDHIHNLETSLMNALKREGATVDSVIKELRNGYVKSNGKKSTVHWSDELLNQFSTKEGQGRLETLIKEKDTLTPREYEGLDNRTVIYDHNSGELTPSRKLLLDCVKDVGVNTDVVNSIVLDIQKGKKVCFATFSHVPDIAYHKIIEELKNKGITDEQIKSQVKLSGGMPRGGQTDEYAKSQNIINGQLAFGVPEDQLSLNGTLLIDDSKSNIAAAQNLGMKTRQVDKNGKIGTLTEPTAQTSPEVLEEITKSVLNDRAKQQKLGPLTAQINLSTQITQQNANPLAQEPQTSEQTKHQSSKTAAGVTTTPPEKTGEQKGPQKTTSSSQQQEGPPKTKRTLREKVKGAAHKVEKIIDSLNLHKADSKASQTKLGSAVRQNLLGYGKDSGQER